MNKFLKRLMLFIPISMAVYFILVCLWGALIPKFLRPNLITIKNNSTFVRLQEVRQYQDIDILFLGSSRAYSTFDVRIYENLGYEVFNLGTSNQSPIQTKVLLERYVESLKPKMVIYAVSPQVLSSDGIEAATDIIANGKLDAHSFLMSLKLIHVKVLNSLIFRIYTQAFNAKPELTGTIDESDRTYIKGGFVEVDLMEYDPTKSMQISQPSEMNEKQIAAFEAIVDLLETHGIKLVLVQVPYVKEEYERHDNDRFNQFISQYGEYYDFNQDRALSEIKYFRDDNHLNKLGIKAFNANLIEQLNLDQGLDNTHAPRSMSQLRESDLGRFISMKIRK